MVWPLKQFQARAFVGKELFELCSTTILGGDPTRKREAIVDRNYGFALTNQQPLDGCVGEAPRAIGLKLPVAFDLASRWPRRRGREQ